MPIWNPVCVRAVPSRARAMPKSMTRGPSSATMMLAGFRSRWMTPAWWIAASASARPAASTVSVSAGRGPTRSRTACNVGPGTYAVTSQAGSPCGSASTTGAVWKPPTRRAAATSSANRRRKPGSVLSSGRTTLTATARPDRDRPK
ncbi:hypothetical protein OHA62_09240 [Streptomyces sp. NBC_00343]|nr:hypothetical protein [Streptomyces sp. NBC_00343]